MRIVLLNLQNYLLEILSIYCKSAYYKLSSKICLCKEYFQFRFTLSSADLKRPKMLSMNTDNVTPFLEKVLSPVKIASKYCKFCILSQMPSTISIQLLKPFPEALCLLIFQSHFKNWNSYISHTKSLTSFKASM